MNKIEEQLKNVLHTISLSQGERAGMRATLVSEMERAPLPVAHLRQSSSSRVKKNIHKKFMPIALLIALLMSGSVSYAAEGTAPGDTLYPVKIHVNEQVRGALALSEVAKAQLEVKLAEERLKEAEKLAGENRLDATTTQQLREDFSQHRSRADGHIEALKGDDDARASAISQDFSERIRGHHGGREALGISDGDDNEEGDDDDSKGEGRGREDSFLGSTTSNTSNTNRIDKSQFNGADLRGEQELRGREQEGEGEVNTEHSLRVESGRRGGEDDEVDDEGDDDHRGRNTASVVTSTVAPTPVAPTPTPATSGTAVAYTLASIASHNNSASCYSAISGTVYNLTAYVNSHPGGSGAILGLCGKDGTAGFTAQHGGASKPQSVLAGFRLGTLQ